MSYLVLVANYYGHADTLAKAKVNLRKEHMGSRKLSDGYTVVEFPEGLEFTGVDMIGQVHWKAKGKEHAFVEPIVTEVKPRRKAS